MSYNNQLWLKVNVNEFVTQIWQLENLVSFDVALAALRNPALQGRHGVGRVARDKNGRTKAILLIKRANEL